MCSNVECCSPHRVAHEAEAAEESKLAGSLALAADVSHETAVRIEHGNPQILAPQVESAGGIEPEDRCPREGEPLGDIERAAEAENLARLRELGIGDELRGSVGGRECDGGRGHGHGCEWVRQGFDRHHFRPVSMGGSPFAMSVSQVRSV